jgi:hypothetical protein
MAMIRKFLLLLGGFLVLEAVAVLFFKIVIDLSLGLPVVEESWTTHECVSVTFSDGVEGSCDALPKRYTHVWVR